MGEKRELKSKNKKSKRKIIVWAAASVVALSVLYAFSFYQNNYRLFHPASETAKVTETSKGPNKLPEPIVSEFKLVIPKLNINVNVSPEVDGSNNNVYIEALKNGVAHYKGTAMPNSGSNVLIFGHSSGLYGYGPYQTIFAKLNNLLPGDKVQVIFNGKTFEYTVDSKKIVTSTDVSIAAPTEREQLTLMTCWPIGSDQKRLVVIAKPAR